MTGLALFCHGAETSRQSASQIQSCVVQPISHAGLQCSLSAVQAYIVQTVGHAGLQCAAQKLRRPVFCRFSDFCVKRKVGV